MKERKHRDSVVNLLNYLEFILVVEVCRLYLVALNHKVNEKKCQHNYFSEYNQGMIGSDTSLVKSYASNKSILPPFGTYSRTAINLYIKYKPSCRVERRDVMS